MFEVALNRIAKSSDLIVLFCAIIFVLGFVIRLLWKKLQEVEKTHKKDIKSVRQEHKKTIESKEKAHALELKELNSYIRAHESKHLKAIDGLTDALENIS